MLINELFFRGLGYKLNYCFASSEILNIIIKYCWKSLLFNNEHIWLKKEGAFDATVGSFDGTWSCNIIVTLLLHELIKKIDKNNVGLYRDDSLTMLRNCKNKNNHRSFQKYGIWQRHKN